MSLRTPAFQRWWPTTQSLDLVEGDVKTVAAAILAEVLQFAADEKVTHAWRQFRNIDAALTTVDVFANVPTLFLVLPTNSKWSVLWNNSFLCDGYDSLCWCLTNNHGLTTIHWSAHDERTTFQPGTKFTYRVREGTEIRERAVYCCQDDNKWRFGQFGTPLPEEDLSLYTLRTKRDRLNELRIAEFLHRLGAQPWLDDFYAFSKQDVFVVQRTSPPPAISTRAAQDVLKIRT